MRQPRGGYSRGRRATGRPMGARGRRGGLLGGMLGGRLGIIVVALAGLAVYWMSNQKMDPFTGKKSFNTISIQDEMRLGQQSYMQILSQEGGNVLCRSGGRSCSVGEGQVVQDIRDIGSRLERAASQLEGELALKYPDVFVPLVDRFTWEYNVISSEQPNAFALPGGFVAIYTGILDITGNGDGQVTLEDIRDPDKLAVVMGHEIAHALARHGAKRMSQQKVMQMGQMAVGVGLGGMDAGQQRAVMQAFGMAAQGTVLKFSREHETEADKIGLELLVRACYDPREAPELWERMGKLGGGQRPPEWMSTHPASSTRAANFRRWMPNAIAQYEANCGPLQ